jgi:SNF2 family DNA or RNA helicase
MTVCFLGGLFRSRTIKNALIVAPLSVLRSWENEAKKVVTKCSQHAKIQVISSELKPTKRIRMIRDAIRW